MQPTAHPERFDPRDQDGKLIDAEHRGRYWWAARAVHGKDVLDAGCGTGYGMAIMAAAGAASVTGIDVAEEAVEEASRRIDGQGEVVRGDLMDPPLPEASYDIVVCFETIEHLADGARALDRLRRLLRPNGVLMASSPNPDVYASGNEFHVHEYRPDELAAAVGDRFEHVVTYHQHSWLASVIERANPPEEAPTPPSGEREVRGTLPAGRDRVTYGIVVASDVEPPDLGALVVLGGDFEVKWWADRAEWLDGEVKRLTVVEKDARHALARAADSERAVRQRLEETSRALLDAEQLIARMPVMEHKLAELSGIEQDHERLVQRIAALEGSKSWRLLAPARRLRRGLRRRGGAA